jgi:amino acid adenylation domain-containing protein/non-ribosomal peptide synthase protein (TIGR01720 family)
MQPDTFEGFRLSPQQKRLWLLQQSDGSLPYRASCVVTIRGALDPRLLEQAIGTVIAHHEILRTSLRLLPGISVPVQVIAEDSTLRLAGHDVSSLHVDARRARVELLLDEAARESDGAERPLVRADLVKVSAGEHALLLTIPGVCADGPSLDRLIGQTAAAYAALAAGADAPDVQAMQYADFAEWQNQLIDGEAASAARAYWKPFAPAGLDAYKLPVERTPPTSTSGFRPSSVPIDLSGDAAARIPALAASRSVPVPAFLLACWQTLLWRLTGQADAFVGVAFHGRKFPELEASIGLFTTYLPMQSVIGDDLAFSTVWRQVADRERDAHRWQEYFAWEGSGFFPFCFELRERALEHAAGDLRFAIATQSSCTDRFKVKVVVHASDERLRAELHFDSSLISVEDARLVAEELKTLVEDASRRPDATVSALDVVGGLERQRLLDDLNDTRKAYASGRCVHALFEDHASRTPDKVAVVYEADSLTYGELNARANQLAHHLIASGAAPDVPVGLCVERSASMIVGLLGILKAGSAYVPLDPGLPKSRLAMILDEAGADLLVTNGSLAEGIGGRPRTVVRLDADGDVLAAMSPAQPPGRAGDENLVYVIFTSGSTGRPKGVAVEHRQLVNYVEAVLEELAVPPASFAMISTVAADLGNTALFPALCSGGTLHVISEGRASDPERLGEYLQRHHVDCLKIVPSHLTALLSGSTPATVLPKARLVLGGEICPWSLVQRIEALAPETVIVNHYGPTEATVGAVTHRIERGESAHASGAVPLGRPLGNVRTYVLDTQLRPTPTGVAGELHISGRGVARGYINRPDATAEKFIPDPFGGEPGARLYKTGDRARYRGDGQIEFLGRTDDQVKVHGYRVEPGEIDVALRAHPAIASGIVVPRQDPSGDTKLVAFLVARDGVIPAAADLRSFLKDRLPEYMTPSAFVFLDRLPLTPNGKVDRQALPADYARHADDRRFIGPRTAAEKALAQIWAGVLGVDPIGVHDNFFELGGDSILSIQIVARANQAGLRLSPRQVFQHQTIAELAAIAETTAVPAEPQGVATGDVPLTPVQARFFELDAPEPNHYNQSALLELEGPSDSALVQQALDHLLRHHDALRLRVVHAGDGWRQRIEPPDAAAPFEYVDLSGLGESGQTAALASHGARLHASLNLATGPVVRAALFDFGSGRLPYLLLVVHHLAVDVVSWGILLDDLETLLRQLRAGEVPLLPPKTTSFRTWAERITAHAGSDARRAELPQWLPARTASGSLPIDHAGGDNTAASARTVSVALSADETSALLQDVPVAYRTQINEVLLSALVRALAPWTGSPALLLDLEGHGREEILDGLDLSRTVGWFTTIFPVHVEGGNAETPAETIRLVKERLRAIPDRGIGYGLLRYASGDSVIADQLRALPQAQVRFNYLGRVDRPVREAPLFRVVNASIGPSQSSSFPRTYLLNVIGSIKGGELHLDWTYSAALHARETVERLARNYVEQLRLVIAGRHAPDAVSVTPSDFPTARLSQEDLAKVLSRMKASQTRRGDRGQAEHVK